jgi:geranylgeranyl diphosphate synthase type II
LKKNAAMQTVSDYQKIFIQFLELHSFEKEPVNLYAPIGYIMGLGGKRLRPVLALMGCDAYGGDIQKAMPVALAIEVFHNFSLVHDDIMDAAPLRRGAATVHIKWDVNTGILSGDAMLIMAYQALEGYEPSLYKSLTQLFSKTALEVCEGQQWDVDFEEKEAVTENAYLHMIIQKTAVLVAGALKMGAMVAGAPLEEQEKMHAFGLQLGIAFQVQDDYLDAFGDPKTFGKTVGGDIVNNKKTLMYIKALELSDFLQRKALGDLFSLQPENAAAKIAQVKALFTATGAAAAMQNTIAFYTQNAFSILETMDIAAENKKMLTDFGNQLMGRQV